MSSGELLPYKDETGYDSAKYARRGRMVIGGLNLKPILNKNDEF